MIDDFSPHHVGVSCVNPLFRVYKNGAQPHKCQFIGNLFFKEQDLFFGYCGKLNLKNRRFGEVDYTTH